MARFGAMVHEGEEAPEPPPPTEADPEMLAFIERMGRNAEFFFAHEYLEFAAWRPDLDALRSRAGVTVIGAGDASGTQPARRAAEALADLLGLAIVEFPGDHGGLMPHADAWTAQLDELLRG